MHAFKVVSNTLILILNTQLAAGQQDVNQCALGCIANVNGTTCSQAQWSCLCANRMYIERMNNCTYAFCSKADQDTTFGAVAQICNVFGYALTYGPEATASTNSDQIFSTQGVLSESSLPPLLSSTISDFPTRTDSYTIATAPVSSSSSAGLASATASASSRTNTATSAAATSSNGAKKNAAGLALGIIAANLLVHR